MPDRVRLELVRPSEQAFLRGLQGIRKGAHEK